MLDKQYHLYSVDTGHFYSNQEKRLHENILILRRELSCAAAKLEEAKQNGSDAECCRWKKILEHKRKRAKQEKEKLLSLLANKAAQNRLTDGRDHKRTLAAERLNDTDVISAFDSALSRMIGIEQDELTDALIIVSVYYFDIFKDISFYGFTYRQETYRYFTSSAGQIRQKKAVFIKESVLARIEKTIMCGLTLARINEQGGNNANKHLAYLALSNSATDEWHDFDIDRTIVVDDFETSVSGIFDFVDETDYSVTRKYGAVPITHTDGVGMMLPCVSSKNFMFRAPWIKGLLGVFDFQKFIEANNCPARITDLFGTEHDIREENIQIIFTKSQFKMHKYYKSWDEYKKAFQTYGCSAGICNPEEDRIKHAKLNYQMLQTLSDITEEEIDLLTRKSAEKITNICSSEETMMQILGITPGNTTMTPFQKAVQRYPSLLSDTYTKDIIRETKNSLLKKYRSGKLEINGKYTFLLPDFYAACEYWFCKTAQPDGLLGDGEVFCRLFRRAPKLDCLRSPHLYKEHAVRNNVASNDCKERAELAGAWFVTDALYTSAHDLISKLLQFDVDGDKSLVVADQDFVRIAERNMEHTVPLYYRMQKAAPTQLNPQTIYEGLSKAFTSGNIGIYSNDIAKIWNHDVFLTGSQEAQKEAADIVKLLCMENNFCIDSAKTLYMPERPKWFSQSVSKYTRGKLPAFFAYAKDKDASQIAERNNSLVNRIYEKIPDRPLNTRGLHLEPVDYRKMMSNETTVCPKEVAKLYDQLNKKYRYMARRKENAVDNARYIICKIREAFRDLGYGDETISDMLVEYLYKNKKRYKQLLWLCYGHAIYKNLEKNIEAKKTKCIACEDCGEWIEISRKDNRTKRCPACQKEYVKHYDRKRKQRHSVLQKTNNSGVIDN